MIKPLILVNLKKHNFWLTDVASLPMRS